MVLNMEKSKFAIPAVRTPVNVRPRLPKVDTGGATKQVLLNQVFSRESADGRGSIRRLIPSCDRQGAVADTYRPMRSFTSLTVPLAMGATRSAPSRRTPSR